MFPHSYLWKQPPCPLQMQSCNRHGCCHGWEGRDLSDRDSRILKKRNSEGSRLHMAGSVAGSSSALLEAAVAASAGSPSHQDSRAQPAAANAHLHNHLCAQGGHDAGHP